MMARYIDADKFAERIKTSPAFNKIGFEGELMQGVVLDLLNNMPAADVAEVKHGEWIWTETGEEDYDQFWVCSVCGEKDYIETNYCPNCGAKMDGGKAE